jgi:hypothetical protein
MALPSHDPGGSGFMFLQPSLYPATPASLLLLPRALPMLLDEVGSQKLTWLLRMPRSI